MLNFGLRKHQRHVAISCSSAWKATMMERLSSELYAILLFRVATQQKLDMVANPFMVHHSKMNSTHDCALSDVVWWQWPMQALMTTRVSSSSLSLQLQNLPTNTRYLVELRATRFIT